MLTPFILEKGSSYMQSIDIFSRLLQDRILFIGDAIDDDLSNIVIAQLLYLDNENQEPIIMYINSPGGSISSGLAIYDTIQHVKSPVHTLCVGTAASMAAILLACGEKGHRAMLPNSRTLIHQAIGGTGYAQCADVQIAAKELQKACDKLAEILSKHTGQTVEKLKSDMDRDYWMSAEEALKYGLIDKIIE